MFNETGPQSDGLGFPWPVDAGGTPPLVGSRSGPSILDRLIDRAPEIVSAARGYPRYRASDRDITAEVGTDRNRSGGRLTVSNNTLVLAGLVLAVIWLAKKK